MSEEPQTVNVTITSDRAVIVERVASVARPAAATAITDCPECQQEVWLTRVVMDAVLAGDATPLCQECVAERNKTQQVEITGYYLDIQP